MKKHRRVIAINDDHFSEEDSNFFGSAIKNGVMGEILFDNYEFKNHFVWYFTVPDGFQPSGEVTPEEFTAMLDDMADRGEVEYELPPVWED